MVFGGKNILVYYHLKWAAGDIVVKANTNSLNDNNKVLSSKRTGAFHFPQEGAIQTNSH